MTILRRADRVLTIATLVAAAYVAAYLAASLVIAPGTRASQILSDVVYMMPSAVATPLVLLAAWRAASGRLFWAIVAASVVAALAGDVAWAVYDLLLHEAPTPSLADPFYLLNVALTIPAALVACPPSRRRWRELVDVVLPLAAVAYWVYEFALAPQLRDGLNGAVAASVGECGIGVLAALVFTAALAGYRDVPIGVKLVYGAAVAQGVSYPIYAYGVAIQGWASVTWIFTGWQVSGVLLVLAAIASLRVPQRPARSTQVGVDVNVWLTTAGLVLVLGIVGLRAHQGRLDTTALDIGLVMVAAVVVRLHEVMRQRGRLARELHRALEAQERLATMDPLTDIPNRRVFDEMLQALVAERGDGRTALGLAILDLDHFKEVNDGYGHPVGDAVLRQAAQRLRAAVRSTDTVARIGGEEFAVIAPSATAESLVALAERCRDAIGAASFRVGETPIALTASVGVARYPDDARDTTALVQAADRALYAAKSQGRDRVLAAAGSVVRRCRRRPHPRSRTSSRSPTGSTASSLSRVTAPRCSRSPRSSATRSASPLQNAAGASSPRASTTSARSAYPSGS